MSDDFDFMEFIAPLSTQTIGIPSEDDLGRLLLAIKMPIHQLLAVLYARAAQLEALEEQEIQWQVDALVERIGFRKLLERVLDSGKLKVEEWQSIGDLLLTLEVQTTTEPVPDGKKEEDEKGIKKLCIGTRVRRGPDWKWGNQDTDSTGKSLTGVVNSTSADISGWAVVTWENGRIFEYRWGHGGCYDLEIIGKPCFEVGDKVRVKRSVKVPRYGWGFANYDSVGTVSEVREIEIRIDFPKNPQWHGLISEIEHVE